MGKFYYVYNNNVTGLTIILCYIPTIKNKFSPEFIYRNLIGEKYHGFVEITTEFIVDAIWKHMLEISNNKVYCLYEKYMDL